MSDPATPFVASDYYYMPECDDIRALRDLSIANNWNDFELCYMHDLPSLAELSEAELDFFKFVYVFLSAADDLVNINIEELVPLFKQKDIHHYYAEQTRIETVHSRTYSQIQLLLFKGDAFARDAYVAEALKDPAILAKIEWLQRIQRESELTVPEKYIIMILVEGIFFASSFASISFLRGYNLFTVMCQSNELISRDEAIHTTASCRIYNNWLKAYPKPSPQRINQLFLEAVEIECAFLTARAPQASRIIDMAAIQNFVRYSGDRLLAAIGMPPLFNVPPPDASFPLALMPIEKHVNFFECRNTAYNGNVINDI